MGTDVEVVREYGKSGRATVRVTARSVHVLFDDEGGTAREFAISDAPENIKSGQGLYVSLNSGNNKVYSVRPFEGVFPVRFSKFVRNNDGAINVKRREAKKVTLPPDKDHPNGRSWPEPARLTFTAILPIIVGPEADLEYAITLDHLFEKAPDGNFKLVGAPRFVKTLQGFMERAGYDFAVDNLPYGQTILDDVEELLLERDVAFQVKVENGWVKEMLPLGPGMDPRRKARKPAAKKAPVKKGKK